MHRRIEIRHPGYAAPNILFSLPANDGPDRDRAHYATIQAIGSVFTESQGDIWLSKSQIIGIATIPLSRDVSIEVSFVGVEMVVIIVGRN